MQKKLWRAAKDDYVDTGSSFAESRSAAEIYLDNAGFGGSTLYKTSIRVEEDQILDLTGVSVGYVARRFGMQHPGAIGLDEWLPRSPALQDALRQAGFLWVLVPESFPAGETTWIWVGNFDDPEPQLEQARRRQAR